MPRGIVKIMPLKISYSINLQRKLSGKNLRRKEECLQNQNLELKPKEASFKSIKTKMRHVPNL